MSKRTRLQQEYFKKFGSCKGKGDYKNDYVKFLEDEVLSLRLQNNHILESKY